MYIDVWCLGTWVSLAVMFGPNTLLSPQTKALEKQNLPSPPLPLIPNCDFFGGRRREREDKEQQEEERNLIFGELRPWLLGGVGGVNSSRYLFS